MKTKKFKPGDKASLQGTITTPSSSTGEKHGKDEVLLWDSIGGLHWIKEEALSPLPQPDPQGQHDRLYRASSESPDPWPVGAVVVHKKVIEISRIVTGSRKCSCDNWKISTTLFSGGNLDEQYAYNYNLIALPPGYLPPEVTAEIERLKQQVLDYEECGRSIAKKLNDRLRDKEARLAQFDALVERAEHLKDWDRLGEYALIEALRKDLAAMVKK